MSKADEAHQRHIWKTRCPQLLARAEAAEKERDEALRVRNMVKATEDTRINRLVHLDDMRLAEIQTLLAERETAEARIATLTAALDDVIDVAIWMSGSSDFGPEGEAGEAWPAARERLYAAMKVRDDAALQEETP